MGWDRGVLRDLVRTPASGIGKKRWWRIESGAASIAQRLEHCKFHFKEIQQLHKKLVGGKSNAELQMQMFRPHAAARNKQFLKVSAHSLAFVQNLHSISDTLGMVIRNVLLDKAIKGDRGYLSDLLKPQFLPYYPGMTAIIKQIVSHPDFDYLKALSNQSKHNCIVDTLLMVSMRDGIPTRLTLSAFEYKGEPYSQVDLEQFFQAEYERQSKLTIAAGCELNQILRQRIQLAGK